MLSRFRGGAISRSVPLDFCNMFSSANKIGAIFVLVD
jgi:hypothetical protein